MAADLRLAKRRATRRIWGVGFGSALGGALAVASVWYLTDPGPEIRFVTQRVAVSPVESVAPRVTPADQWATEVAAGARESTAAVSTSDDTPALAGAIALHDDGYLITSGRALGDATEVVVHTHDGEMITATVLGYDHETDLSVLKTDGAMVPAGMAADPAADGDIVATVDPNGTADRHVVADLAASAPAVDGDLLVGFTTLDAPRADLPPGSPVVDATGAVVGITTAVDAEAPVTVVPIDVANKVAAAIITDGEVEHPWIGVTAIATDDGVTVDEVVPDGPADRAGVEPGDLLLAIDGDPLESATEMVARLRSYGPGDVVELVVERGDGSVVLDAVLAVEPEITDD